VLSSTLSRIEMGKAPTRTGYLSLMLDLYDIDDAGQRQALTDLARGGRRPSWWAGRAGLVAAGAGLYLDLEAEATAVEMFSALTVPGLLQTRAYTAAVIAARRPGLAAGQVHRLAELQLRRQDVLHGIGLRGCMWSWMSRCCSATWIPAP